MTMPRNYYRIMLGKKSMYAKRCYEEGFIGADYSMDFDLSGMLSEDWRDFNRQCIPEYQKRHPDKQSKIAAGLACGTLYTVAKGIRKGDIVLGPTGSGSYYVGEVTGDYTWKPGEILQHRRAVKWYPETIDRADMSPELQASTGSSGTVANISKHAKELVRLIEGNAPSDLSVADETVEDPSEFALEKHLEDFLVRNWSKTLLGKNYDIVKEDGEFVGQQYPTDTGYIDILAVSKNGKELLVVELKKGRASDVVVGQIQRYMGYVLDELADDGQTVRGVIIALEDDIRLKRALKVANNIDFYRYQVSFKLFKG